MAESLENRGKLRMLIDKFQFVWMLNIDLTTYSEWGQKVSTYFLMVNKIK